MSDSCFVKKNTQFQYHKTTTTLLGSKNLRAKTGQTGYALSILDYVWGLNQETQMAGGDQCCQRVEKSGSCFIYVCFLGGITPCLGSAVTINRACPVASPCSLGLLKNDLWNPKGSNWRVNSQRVSGPGGQRRRLKAPLTQPQKSCSVLPISLYWFQESLRPDQIPEEEKKTVI